ncbi:MAG: c-type cytochrome [Sulfuricaulis sp.]
MKQVMMRRLFAMGFALVMLAPIVSQAAEPQDIIKYRQNMMKAIGAHTAAAGAILMGKVDYKNQLNEHVRSLEALTSDIPGLFPKGSDFGDTRAKDAVWTKRADFEKHAKTLKARVAAFAKAVKSGNHATELASFKDMGEGCKACHKDFRKKEEK